MKSVILLLLIILYSCNKSPSTIIDGYQNKISYYPTEKIEVFLNAKQFGIKPISLFDINGLEIDRVVTHLIKQDVSDTSYWWKYGFNYKKTFNYNANKLNSGLYYFENGSPFIIKNPTKKNNILVVYPSNTVNAYNKRGGRSLYSNPFGIHLSCKRPTKIDKYAVGFLKWLPNQKFKVDYICDIDLDDYSQIKNYNLIVITGHSEYWTRKARLNFDRFVNEGGNALVLSGNTMWWQVRVDNNKMTCYKNYINDSLVTDSLKTICWNDSILNYPILSSIGSDFDNGGFGLKNDSGWNGYKVITNSSLFKNTRINVGDIINIPTAEYDGAPLVFRNGIPKIDTNKLNFYRQELLAYDRSYRSKETFGTIICFKKTKKSGVIINVGSTNWCSIEFLNTNRNPLEQLTYNCIDSLSKK